MTDINNNYKIPCVIGVTGHRVDNLDSFFLGGGAMLSILASYVKHPLF